MYTTKLSVILLTVFITILIVEAQQLTGFPPLDQPPPFNESWNALVDQSKLPLAPININETSSCTAEDTFCDWSCTNCIRPASDFDHCPRPTDWALTYDDGPTNFTLRVLDALNARGLKATFFVIGSRVVENPGILKQVVDAGHQIGAHTWSHTPLTTQTNEQIIAETKWTELAIQQAVNLTPKWFRPPRGNCDDRVRGILTQLGYKIAFWDHDTLDWESVDDPNFDLNWIPGNFTLWTQNVSTTGHASLEHDAFDKTSSMASQAMDIVLNAKITPEPISVCLGEQAYVESVQPLQSNPINATNATNATNTISTVTTVAPTSTTVIAVASTPTVPIVKSSENSSASSASSIEMILLSYIVWSCFCWNLCLGII